jgi:hypothetical protein
MTQPKVTITELDGALGVLPPTAGRLFAIVGPSSSGVVAVPATFARIKDVQATFGSGPLVEAAAHYIERYGRPVVLVKTTASVSAAVSAVADNGATGTSVVTASVATPVDDYDLVLKIVNGGTRGTAGITYKMSLDGGVTYSAVTALGTATSAAFPDSAGVTFAFAAGTLVAGDYYTARATAALWSTSDLQAALDALGVTAASWEIVQVVGKIDASAFAIIEPKIEGLKAAGKYHAWIGNTRIPAVAESEATYLSSLASALGSSTSKNGSLYAGSCRLTSSVSGRRYLRPVSFATAAREASVSEEIDIADVNLGALDGVTIRDLNGNPEQHDESVNPGLDDARFAVLRTVDGYPGIYVNRPRLFSNDTSDFQIMPHRRVLNLVHDALRVYFIRRLNKPIIVSKTTGFILESEALEIETGAIAIMTSVALAKPKASAVEFALSRSDNLLSTKTITGQARVVPLAYPEFINLDVGFKNPALQIVAQ